MADAPTRRVELVAAASDSKQEAARTGGGLMVGLFLGRHSLVAAATGTEQFEVAVAHFVGLVLASVAGALFLGAIFDRVSRSTATADTEAAETAEADAAEPSPSPELPIGMPT